MYITDYKSIEGLSFQIELRRYSSQTYLDGQTQGICDQKCLLVMTLISETADDCW